MHGHRATRTERLLALLLSRKGKRVSLPEVQRVAGAQHGARVAEARALHYVIRNDMERQPDGAIHSFYTLVAEPYKTPPMFPPPSDRPLTDDLSRAELEQMRKRR